MKKIILLITLLILILTPGLAFATTAEDVDALAVGNWIDLSDGSDSVFGDVYCGSADDRCWAGSWTPGGGVFRYSGGAYDTTGNRILVFGGGHSNYGGNEIYDYDLDTFAWSMLEAPSTQTDIQDEYDAATGQDGWHDSSGRPASMHTRAYISYDPNEDRLYGSVMSALYAGVTAGNHETWHYDIDADSWATNSPYMDNPVQIGHVIMTVNTNTGDLWQATVGEFQDDLYQFTPSTDTWSASRYDDIGTDGGSGDSYNIAFDPNNNYILIVGAGGYISLDITTPTSVTRETSYTWTGGNGIVSDGNNDAGLTFWDQGSAGLFVGYSPQNTTTDVFLIHPTNHFVIKLPATTGGVTPTTMSNTGLALGGRMAVGTVPDSDVMLVVIYQDNSDNYKVFGYKISENANDSTGPAVSFSNFPTDSGTQVIDLSGVTDTTTDDSLILGCQITESDTPPATFTDSWTLACPSSYDTGGNGNFNLRVWKYDVFGNTGKQNYIVNVNAVTNASNDLATNGVDPTVLSNIDAIEFRWPITGDANEDTACTVEYGEGNYDSDGMPCFRMREPTADGSAFNELNGNIMFLDAGTTYWIRIIITDPDGGSDTYTGTATTKSWPTRPTGGNTYYAVASGGGGTTCSEGSPCTLTYLSQNKVVANDIIKLKAGTYTGTYWFSRDGAANDEWILWETNDDGDVTIQKTIVQGDYNWFKDFKVDADLNCNPFDADGTNGVIDSMEFTGGKLCGTCASSQCGPSNLPAIHIDTTADDWIIMDSTIDIDRTWNTQTTTSDGAVDRTTVVIADVFADYPSDFFDVDGPNRKTYIVIISNGDKQLVSGFDPATGTFTTAAFAAQVTSGTQVGIVWDEHYSSEGILAEADGLTVAYNDITGVADGISCKGANMSIFGNDVWGLHDDGIEPDDAPPNTRIWGNRVTGVINFVSLQDQENGMLPWIVKNQFTGSEQGILKMRGGTYPGVLYHNTFIVWGDMVEFESDEVNARKLVAKNNIFISYDGGIVWKFGPYSNEPYTDINYNVYDHQQEPFPWEYIVSVHRADMLGSPSWNEDSGHDGNSKELNMEDILNNYPTLAFAPPYPRDYISKVHLTLKVGTNAIDNGVVLNNINDNYNGTAPDIGAYEYGDPDTPIYGPREEEEVPPLPDIVGVSVQ